MNRIGKIVVFFSMLICFGVFAQDTLGTLATYSYYEGGDSLWTTGPRGVLSGTDLDQDGKQEVWATSYDHKVHCFEYVDGNVLELVWSSADVTADYSTPRDLHAADLDGDGNGEIVFHIGRWTGDGNPDNGIQIYEWDGTDNGFGVEPAFQIDLYDALNDSIGESRVEGFSIADIDGDGTEEILLANNGGSNPYYGTVDGSTAYSEDRFFVLSIAGDIGGFGTAVVMEYAMSPRDVDKDGSRENALGGGSPQDIVVCDTDGDGLLEAACISWNNLAVFFFEATGPDAYSIGDTNYVKLANSDDWTLGASVADMDGDGKDEVYIPGFYDGEIFMITDADGDATSLDTTGSFDKNWVGNTEIAIVEAGLSLALGTSAYEDVLYVGGGGGAFHSLALNASGSVLNAGDFTASVYSFDDPTGGGVNKLFAGSDLDDDGNMEVVLAYQGAPDSVVVIDGTDTTTVVNPSQYALRIAEWSAVGIDDFTIIAPSDYKLSQNYPNPFNPTTNIDFYLPLQKAVSLTVYNMLGQEVVTLVNNEVINVGSHTINWDGLDKNGVPVSSGSYIYELKFGNFNKTKLMTLLK
ncbi:MAG: T9SS type A sorting domain-containing protein [Candidatus Marinimicrobia bacterium]|nr:T9SS type A sorting domain-containing protein [Candidatus Neomarinimicrobiota bacterium]